MNQPNEVSGAGEQMENIAGAQQEKVRQEKEYWDGEVDFFEGRAMGAGEQRGDTLPSCECGHEENLHWPESQDKYKLRRCSSLGCSCERYEPKREVQPLPAAQLWTVNTHTDEFYKEELSSYAGGMSMDDDICADAIRELLDARALLTSYVKGVELPAEEMFFFETGSDGYWSAIVSFSELKQTVHNSMCMCGQFWEKCGSAGVPETCGLIDDNSEWEFKDGDYRWSWGQDFEDGFISVKRLMKPLSGVELTSAQLKSVESAEGAFLRGQQVMRDYLAEAFDGSISFASPLGSLKNCTPFPYVPISPTGETK